MNVTNENSNEPVFEEKTVRIASAGKIDKVCVLVKSVEQRMEQVCPV